MEARFIHGKPLMLDYTPGSAVDAGDVVVIGDRALIAHKDIAANELGALASGGAVYEVTADDEIDPGKKVFWDASAKKVTETAEGNAKFGFVLPDESSDADGDKLRVQHDPGKTSNDSTVVRDDLTQEALVAYTIPLTSLRVHDALATNLPGTAANDDMALITGTPGTDAPTLQGTDFGGGSTDEKGAFEFVLPPEYDAGESITVRVKAGMLTTVSDGTATIDVECWKDANDGSVGADLCATAAQSINSLTLANKDFVITPTGLAAGDRLIFRLSFGGSDTGNAGVMIPEIQSVKVLLDIKG